MEPHIISSKLVQIFPWPTCIAALVRTIRRIRVKTSKKAWFIDEVFDVENVIKGVISKEQWKKEMAEATIFKYYDKEDQETVEDCEKRQESSRLHRTFF